MVFAVVALLEMGLFYYEFSMLGFPDGHLTELGKVRKLAYPVFSSWFCILALIAFFVGLKPAKDSSRKTIIVFVVILILLNVAVFSLDHLFSLKFENGTGG